MFQVDAELKSVQIGKEPNTFKMVFVTQEVPTSFLDTLKEHWETTDKLTFGHETN